MVDDTESAVWPLPKFYFSVDFDDQQKNIPFQEVSGLDAETQIIEYRADDSKGFDTIKMPGIVKVGNVTFKRGIFINNNEFFDWFSKIKMNTIKRETIT
ncbi:phage tail protein, partial [Planktotalea sp.]|uniref:phage tail protein n=1 Tax=Planktotalea sp. TaxID=2029877 RepID=UPI003298674F